MGNFKDWLNKVGSQIGGFFSNIFDTVRDWWNEGSDWISKNIPEIIEVAEVIKRFLKGEIDNVLITKVLGIRGYKRAEKVIIRGLERSITYLGHVEDVNECLEKQDPEEKITCLLEKLKALTKKGEEGSKAFIFAKEALLDVLEERGMTIDDKMKEKAGNIVQAFYDAKTLDKAEG